MARNPISAQQRYRILARDGFACQTCGAKAPNVTLQVDHVIPVAKGGSDHETNLRALCVTCNLGKSDADPVTSENVAVQIAVPETIRIATNEVAIHCMGEALSEPILWIGEYWAVTDYGIERRDGTYPIEKTRLWEGEPNYSWSSHIRDKHLAVGCLLSWELTDEGEKIWPDFNQALAWAREYFKHLKPKTFRQRRTTHSIPALNPQALMRIQDRCDHGHINPGAPCSDACGCELNLKTQIQLEQQARQRRQQA